MTITNTGFERVAHLKTFPLLGGEQAIKEPKKIAIALFYQTYGNYDYLLKCLSNLSCIAAFTRRELDVLRTMLEKDINAPLTSSMGRLFDGVAALLGIRQQISYEGQAAMELEAAIGDFTTDESYGFELTKSENQAPNSSIIIDWQPIVRAIAVELTNKTSTAEIAVKFHNTLVEIIIAVTQQIGRKQIVLRGCWQNKYLSERAIARLKQENFVPYWHRQIPCNDSGIAVGQVMAALRTTK